MNVFIYLPRNSKKKLFKKYLKMKLFPFHKKINWGISYKHQILYLFRTNAHVVSVRTHNKL